MAETGRAAVFVGTGKPFELREYPVPDPGERDIVVQVSRANICGSDLHLWRGDTNLAAMGLTYGVILGHEMCGVVARKGSKVRTDSMGKPLREGDRIVFSYFVPCDRCPSCLKGAVHMCMNSLASPVRNCDEAPHFLGGFADYYYLKSRQSCFVVPDDLDDGLLAGANCALSQVLWGLEQAQLRLGETVVVQGAGGLGLFACAVAKSMGASKVIAIDAIPARLELAREFGADEVIDIGQCPDKRMRVMQVMGSTGGWGADVVVEVVGRPEVINEGIRMLGRGGRYLELGCINPKHTFKADPSLLVGFNRSILGISLYPPEVLPRAVAFLQSNQDRFPFHKLLSHDYALEDIDKAFAASDTFGDSCGGVARASITPGGLS
ncbi:MAG: zinc-binding dehydrogenase [Myxococcota bacterium]|nr:zinc-binding dehydrogenase [Myxococcota bacterium]